MFFDILAYGFAQRAVIGGIIIALCCAILGTFLVLRRLSLIGDGIAHLSFGGLAAGMLIGVEPMLVALVVALLGSIWVSRVVTKLHVYGDTAIAIIIALGTSTGVIIIGAVKGFTVNLFSFLFGSILTLSPSDIYLSLAVLAAVLIFVLTQYRKLVLLSFHEELALTHGIRANALNVVMGMLAAATVVISIRAVGIMLVSALLVIPAATGMQISRSFKQTLIFSIIIALIAVLFGIFFALSLDLPVGGLIVLCLIVQFCLSLVYKKFTANAV